MMNFLPYAIFIYCLAFNLDNVMAETRSALSSECP
jgi:hypothetical protein